MPQNPLSAEVTADVSDYVSGMTTASERTDELGDQAGQAARKVDQLGEDTTATAGKLGGYTAAVGAASGATGALSTVTTASLIPALAALSTTLVPLAATLGAVGAAATGVAAGFGAVLASGAFAYGSKLAEQNKERLGQLKAKREGLIEVREETGELTDSQQEQLDKLDKQIESTAETTTVMGALKEELQPVKEQLQDTATTLGSEFIPLIRDAIDALPAFIREMEAAIGPLQPFADTLREAGNAAFEVIPKITSQIMDMGRDALPAVRNIGSAIADTAVPALEAMGETADEVLPLFEGLGGAIASLLPPINDLGLAILEAMVPRIRSAINTIVDLNEATDGWLLKGALLVSAVGTAASAIGSLGSVITGAVSAIGTIVGILGGPLTLAVVGVGAAIAGLWYAWQNNVGNIQEKTDEVVSDVTGWLSQFTDEVESIEETIKTSFDEVVNSFATLTDEANEMRDIIEEAFAVTEDQAEETGSSVEDILEGVDEAIEMVGDTISFVVRTHYEPMMQRINKLAEIHLGPTIDEFIETFNAIVDRMERFATITLDLWNRYGDDIMAVVKPAMKFLRISIASGLDVIMTTIRVALNIIQGDWEEAFIAIENFFDRYKKRLKEAFTVLKQALTGAWDLLVTALEDAWGALWDAVEKELNTAWNSIVSFFEGTGKADVHKAFKAIGSAIRDALLPVLKVGGDIWNSVTNLFGKLKTYVMSGKAWSDMTEGFSALVDGIVDIWDGALKVGGTVWNIVTDIFDDIKTYVMSGQAYKDMRKAWGALVGVVTSAFQGLYDGLIGESLIPDMIGDIKDYLKETGKKLIKDGISALITGAKDAFDWLTGTGDGTLLGSVKSTIGDLKSWLSTAFSNFDLSSIVNSAVGLPWEISVPEVTVADQTFGGGTISVPGFNTGNSGSASGFGDGTMDAVKDTVDETGGVVDSPVSGPTYTGGDVVDSPVSGPTYTGGDVVDNPVSGPIIPNAPGVADPDDIPDQYTSAATGGFIAEGGLTNVHEGERVVPASQVTDRGAVEAGVDGEQIADAIASGFERASIGGEQDITIELRDAGRYQTARR